MTNAHVVAGVDRPSVIRPDGRRLPASVLTFDPTVTSPSSPCPDWTRRPFRWGRRSSAAWAPSSATPAARTRWRSRRPGSRPPSTPWAATSTDGRPSAARSYILAAQLLPGDSGGALVDTDGVVVGVAFAVAPDQPATAYALAGTELRAVLDQPRAEGTDTGSCLG